MSLVFWNPSGDDYLAVSEIHNAQNEPDHHHPPKTFRRWDETSPRPDPYAERYVAVLDGEVVATGYRCHSWGGMRYPNRYWVSLHVRHDFRGQGIDTQLLHYALKDLEPPAQGVWTVVREDFLGPLDSFWDENFVEQGRTWGAHLDLETFGAKVFQDVQGRLEAEGIRFLPYQHLDNPNKHTAVQALHAEAKRDMPLFEPVATAEFDDMENEATLPETVMVAVMGNEIVGVSSVDRGDSMLHFGLTAVSVPYRYRGVGRVLKALSAKATKNLGHAY